jgi:hypothetical protein
MAFTENMQTRTYISGSVITQFTFVTLAADGQVDKTGDGLRTDGVALFGATGANQAIPVAYDGRVTVLCGGTFSRGDDVASDADGKAVSAASSDVILGYALEDGASGRIVTIELSRAEKTA